MLISPATRFDGADLSEANFEGTVVDSFFVYDDSTQFPDELDISEGINLDDYITGDGGTLTWGMALRNGERIPESKAVIDNIKLLAQRLEALQQEYNLQRFSVNSWYRPPEVNRQAGGADTSAHLEGKAADVSWSNISKDSCKEIIEQQIDTWPGHLACSSSFMHLDLIEPFPIDDESKTWEYQH